MPAHFKHLRPWREMRRSILRDYQGTLFPNAPDRDFIAKQIVNFTLQAAEAMVQTLAANRPRFLITPKAPKFTAFASKMERALNRYAALLHMEEILQEIVRDAYSTIGIGKLYMADSIAVGFEQDYRADPGKPFLQRVCLDHYVYDTTGTSWPQVSFASDRYRISYDQLMADIRFKKWRDKFRNLCQNQRENEESAQIPAHLESVTDYLWLADVYVAAERRIYTYVVDTQFHMMIDQPIATQKWNGEDCGPYHYLNLGPVPDECMPTSPGQNLKLLNELANTLYRKLEQQARRQKIITVGHNADPNDLEALRKSEDGEHVPVSNPDSVSQLRFDGPDAQLAGFYLSVQQQLSRAAGNLDHKLGLAATTRTIGQESMIGEAVSRMEQHQQQRYVAFVRRIAKGLARLLWNDGFTTIEGVQPVEGTPFMVDDTWLGAVEPGARQGEFNSYEVDIDPYALVAMTPSEKLAAIRTEVQTWLPALPMLMQLGVAPDIAEYFKQVERLSNLPEISKIFKTDQQPMEPAAGGRSGGSANGGVYRHVSSGASPKDPQADAVAMMSQGGGNE